jgi:hypothetical protein
MKTQMGEGLSRGKAIGFYLLVGMVTIAVSVKLVCLLHNRVQICGSPVPGAGDIAEIKRAVRGQIFASRPVLTPAWVPVWVQNCLWAPMERVILDVRHPIDLIEVQRAERVKVWYRGPEMKAYVDGKEHGWFPQSISLEKGPGGWTNLWLQFP